MRDGVILFRALLEELRRNMEAERDGVELEDILIFIMILSYKANTPVSLSPTHTLRIMTQVDGSGLV